jgi:hypothetical protein
LQRDHGLQPVGGGSVPEHPESQCPEKPCPCVGTTGLVMQKTEEMVTSIEFLDAQKCEDCHVLVPLADDCYGIDCGNVVCLPCGVKRGLSDEYRLP